MTVTKRFQKAKSNVCDWVLIGLITILVAAPIGGYVANIVALAHIVAGPLTGMVLLRIAGVILPPLGVVLGYV